MRTRSHGVLLVALLATLPPACQRRAGEFEAGRAHAWVETLAADRLDGRRTGTSGGDRAARLIAEAFEQSALEPAGDDGSYLHRFTFPFYRFVQPVRLAIDSAAPNAAADATEAPQKPSRGRKELVYGEDYFFLNGSSATSGEAEVVFVGYGLATSKLDELEGVEVRGKVLLAMDGMPPHSRLERRLAAHINKAKRARELGAAGLLLVSDPGADVELDRMRIWVFRPRNYLPGFFLAKVNVAVAQALLDGQGVALKQRIDRGEHASYHTGKTVAWQVGVEYVTEKVGANVLGLLEGSDPELADELVLVGAHYDGGGRDPDGTVYNGAEDNASGTAAVLELARVMAAEGPSARSVMFALWGAEEQGVWGSSRFLEQVRWPLDKIVFTLTLDNVGVGEDRFRLYGAHNFPEEVAVVRAGVAEELFAHFTSRGAGGSDGWSFQIQGIPALFAHADAPQPYVHTPEDDAGTISPEMLRVVGLFSDQALRAAADVAAGSYDTSGRLARYLWRYGFVTGIVKPGDEPVAWETLRTRGFDLVLVEPAGQRQTEALRASVPASVRVVSEPGELSDREEGAPLRVLFLGPGDLKGAPELVRVTAASELSEPLLDPEADVALVFDAADSQPRELIRRLVEAGVDRERVEALLDRLRSHLVLRIGAS